jgi:ABC-type Fe3+/spermidine/putrescine transport system ATPase subunit
VTHDQSEAMAMADRVAVMDAGRVLQVAAPREMYERPASRRVAEFFGDINVWSAVVGIASGTVDIPDLRLAVRVPIPLPTAGSPLAVALRPERIAIARDPISMGDCSVSGTIAEAVYLGMTCTYFVKLTSGAVVRVTAQNGEGTPSFNRGDAVHLSWQPAALTVLSA